MRRSTPRFGSGMAAINIGRILEARHGDFDTYVDGSYSFFYVEPMIQKDVLVEDVPLQPDSEGDRKP